MLKSSVSLLSLALLLLVGWSCSSLKDEEPAETGSVLSEMHKLHSTSHKLLQYVWMPSLFYDSAHEAEISRLLKKLDSGFHKVDRISTYLQDDPGFKIALTAQENALADIRYNFGRNNKEYANWRLRGLTHNCVGCHSRFEVGNDVLRVNNIQFDRGIEGQIAEAEYLMASRNFEAASKKLYALANSLSKYSNPRAHALEVLKLWLVIEVRVRPRPLETANFLEQIQNRPSFSEEERDIISSWINDLVASEQEDTLSPIELASDLLAPVSQEVNITNMQKNLVNTLRSTRLLHTYLREERSEAQRRQAVYLLAIAYTKMPIESFEVFGTMFLEQCIREFPGSPESKQAFEIFKENLEFESSGSSGLNLEIEDAIKLGELEALANFEIN